jgi:4-hydroxybenzoate polyprenyltransferase
MYYLHSMKLAGAFFRLIRFPNLFFIALTQILFYFCIIVPSFSSAGINDPLGTEGLLYIIAASIFIAAGGYVINDYFDLNIDRVNKPGKLVVDHLIRRRWAIIWHFSFSLAGIILSLVVSYKLSNPLPAVFNVITVFLLWFYSTSFKKQVLVGNIIISLLTGWVVLVLYVSVNPIELRLSDSTSFKVLSRVYKFAVLYGGFAFIISLVREVIKDMEDIQGDAKYNCRTMPIVWGLPASKMFVAVWMIVLICSMVILQVYALQLSWWWSALYSIIFIITPLVTILRRLFPALAPAQFHELSTLIKIVMLTGIVSMLFIKWYS